MKFFSGPEQPHKLASSGSHASPKLLRALYPLTRRQAGIWLEYQMNPESTRYNLTLEWTLEKDDKEYDATLGSVLKGKHLLMTKYGS